MGNREEYADQGKELTTKEANNIDNNRLKEPPKHPDSKRNNGTIEDPHKQTRTQKKETTTVAENSKGKREEERLRKQHNVKLRAHSGASYTPTVDKDKGKKVGKLKVMLVGDSQLRRVDEANLTNDHHVVEKIFKPGMKIKKAASLARKSSSDVIIIHAGTNNVGNSSPEQLCKDVSEQPKS
eukprot:Seg873.11 transcript_id=Seg873.11/GoldUCD/mRNA.D3Y31 product="hypothetical protein" protein_id=Seg873.11/GoldUCD/D3Y31